MNWTIQEGVNSHIFDCRIFCDEIDDVIAFCDIDNAALICAAPDLLDALIDATDNCLWRSDSDIPLSADESQRIYNKAMAAIAKAKQLTNNNQ